MRSKRYRFRIFLFFSLLTILVINVGSDLVINKYLPNEIKILVNEERDFLFNIPLDAKLNGNLEGVVMVNQEPVKDNLVLNLQKSFTIKPKKTGVIDVELKLFGILPIKNVKVDVVDSKSVVPVGKTIGVTVYTDGILVLGTGLIYGEDGKKYNPAKGKLYTGDYIKTVNGKSISRKKELIEFVKKNNGEDIQLEVVRNGERETVNITPVKTLENGEHKIGIWVRDDTQGIGTMTYIDLDKKTFGALGHGITDVDTNQLIEVGTGEVVNTMITTIKKGEDGIPGEISGIIVGGEGNRLGEIEKNTSHGIFGEASDEGIEQVFKNDIIPIGYRYDVHEGEAVIRSDVSGKLKDYKILIKKIYLGDESNKGMIIEVVDDDLIKTTNGIIQGMSGSPIIQDGKLIGAVTHVFVQDSKKGYGIFIENMLAEE
ncbi:SpoIVB peptidase [Vallitalea longa]|uniref:SpoIVB peptidase n=1 Tax=Vallitalea longa TaxID=2936439 RepID=A0A9W6DHY2_9FIRM|nr:SpoIVB peptidase [Vallitalea longa]GKX31938.1 SpoIVB peptidase [Vallitalea longa]